MQIARSGNMFAIENYALTVRTYLLHQKTKQKRRYFIAAGTEHWTVNAMATKPLDVTGPGNVRNRSKDGYSGPNYSMYCIDNPEKYARKTQFRKASKL